MPIRDRVGWTAVRIGADRFVWRANPAGGVAGRASGCATRGGSRWEVIPWRVRAIRAAASAMPIKYRVGRAVTRSAGGRAAAAPENLGR